MKLHPHQPTARPARGAYFLALRARAAARSEALRTRLAFEMSKAFKAADHLRR